MTKKDQFNQCKKIISDYESQCNHGFNIVNKWFISFQIDKFDYTFRFDPYSNSRSTITKLNKFEFLAKEKDISFNTFKKRLIQYCSNVSNHYKHLEKLGVTETF